MIQLRYVCVKHCLCIITLLIQYVTPVYYLAQQKTVTPCVILQLILTFIIEAFHLVTNVQWTKWLIP